MLESRIKNVSFAFLFHMVVLLFGILAPIGISNSRLAVTGTFADNFIQWDSQWFLNIGRYGYAFPHFVQEKFARTGNIVPFDPPYKAAAFFPGVPTIVHLFGVVGALIIVNLCFLLCLWLIFGLVAREKPKLAVFATILFAVNPCAIFFSSLYSETFTVLAVLLILTGFSQIQFTRGYILTLVGVLIATSVHDLGAFAGLFIIRFIRLRRFLQALGYLLAGILVPIIYELYLINHFHTPVALFAAEASWNREWKIPFANVIETLENGSLSLNTLFVLSICLLVIWQIVLAFKQDHRWTPAQENGVLYSFETGIWMSGILLLALCAYIPTYPLQSVLRFFCILWPIYIPAYIRQPNRESAVYLRYLLVGSFSVYAAIGAALFTHGWFFQ